ncbi:hypothetical protein ABRP77_05610 [Pectobacterium odoriferum]|uniref:hypothetical protein n=2 Tax=Pectobacterium odoriferum TaxID=78398 RepID=UPI0032EF7962
MTENTNGNVSAVKKRKVTLRAFEIKNQNISKPSSDLNSLLINKLNSVKVAKERCMILAQDDPNQLRDLISYFKASTETQSVFCTMLRISAEKDVQHITDALFEKDVFTMDDIDSSPIDTSAICKDHYFFSMNGKHLVTNLPLNKTITRLQTYLNWFIDSDSLEFTPMISVREQTQLSDLKSIIVRDPEPIQLPAIAESSSSVSQALATSNGKAPATGQKTIALGEKVLEIIKKSMSETKTLDDITLSQMISAELLIKFKKPRKMTDDEYKRILGAYLKPVSDLENITFKRKDGKSEIKGKDLLKTKPVDIEMTPTGKLVEQQLLQEMNRFLKELS